MEEDASDLTVTAGAPEVVATADSNNAVSSAPGTLSGRFLPGTVLAGRYRVFGLLGKGGMGEVYRADDLKLGQPVALKFLPGEMCTDAMLARFYNEVRVARQITHPNACRVHDILEIDGQHFLSMEFIDGEDLASLLRRIGRLPKDKALDIVRQLCAGLAAAHDKGVLHRDLKPANIMIDGRGQVRITDFGLAGLAEEIVGREIRAGTPAYMSPEQIAGKEVSVRSDIYALGLVLYETFTGRRVFKADTVAQISEMHQSATPTRPSEILDDFDPVVERVILRCLEKDPDRRPQSALAIAAMLPGGDPLAAALAAGETPSPEMVAAAGGSGTMKPAMGVVCLAGVLAGLVLATMLSREVSLVHKVPLDKPPVVLEDRARQILAELGYGETPADSARWLGLDNRYLQFIEQTDTSADRWDALKAGQPAVAAFVYRQSPDLMRPINADGAVSPDDPPPLLPGMVNVNLDSSGRLLDLRVVTDRKRPNPDEELAVDYSTVFAVAGLDLSAFEPIEPEFSPPVHYHSLRAWQGVYPDQPELALQVQVAAAHGQCVYFHEVGPWSENTRSTRERVTAGIDVAAATTFALQLIVLVGSVILARRNLRLGRGDRRGAWRLAVFLFVVQGLTWLLVVHHGGTFRREWELIDTGVAMALWSACFPWCLYVAVEPFVRRTWPETLISWTRLLGGRFRDPLVGRDALLGCTFAVALTLCHQLHYLAPTWFGLPPPSPLSGALGAIVGPRPFVARFLMNVPEAIYLPMIFLLVLLLLRVVVRNRWAAVTVFFGLVVALYPLPVTTANVAIDLVARAVFGAILIGLLLRRGVFVLMVQMFFTTMLLQLPLTFDTSQWYAWTAITAMAGVTATAAYGFWASLAGRPLLTAGVIPE